ncbi:MAG: hypothetical protein U9R05_11020 [Chloroflexota bacterium]|nr:hypothetical protein [Chloroflexota bacterium]
MPVIANTTIISNFAASGRVELLHTLWNILYIPEQVYDEIQAGLLLGYDFYADIHSLIYPFSENGWLYLTSLHSSDEFRLFGELTSTLHSGEAACLSIAAHRQWTFLSDDKAARRAGASLNIPVSGTLGVLLALVKHGQLALTEADTMLIRMIQAGYFSPVFSLREILSR